MTAPKPPVVPEPLDVGPPTATLTQLGPRRWYVEIQHGLIQWGPDGGGWFVWGWTPAHAQRRAERAAAKHLAQYRRTLERRAASYTITEETRR